MAQKFLTFDLGTTLYKVALFDDSGQLLGVRRVTPHVLHPKPGWWELDPRTFHLPLIEAARALRDEVGAFDDVAAVSFATQANSFVLLDDCDRALTPIVLWPDERAGELGEEFEEIGRLPDFRSRTGMPRFGPALALAKVLRWKNLNRSVLEETDRFCYLSDLVTLWMIGRHVSEGGVAGLSGAMDVNAFAWWEPMLERVGLRKAQMPVIARAGTDLGRIHEDVAAEMGLPGSCMFVVGCLDQYAGAIGTATVEAGRVCETTGTVLAAVRMSDRIDTPLRDDVFRGPSFDPGRFFHMTFSRTSANLLEWYRNSLPDLPSFEELSRLAAGADDAVIIEPCREGEPIESCFRNVRPKHSAGQVARGIMRCVAEALKRQILSLSPTMPRVIRSAGGAARSDVWLQTKADVLGTTFEAVDCEEPTSMGAAMLAARAITGRSMNELARDWVRVRKTFRPLRGTGASPVQK
jgi:xylulokinase